MKRKVMVFVVVWFAVAIAVAASGMLAGAKPPALQVIVASETFLLVILYLTSSSFAEFARSVPLSRLTFFHLWRVLPGAGFLLLYHRGLMPHEFTVPAGIGDVAVALLAPIFAWIALRSTPTSVKAVLAFHLLGLLDLVMVVSNAARISFADPTSMRMLSQAPLVIVPIFFVPITIFLHIIAIDQCRRALSPALRASGSNAR